MNFLCSPTSSRRQWGAEKGSNGNSCNFHRTALIKTDTPSTTAVIMRETRILLLLLLLLMIMLLLFPSSPTPSPSPFSGKSYPTPPPRKNKTKQHKQKNHNQTPLMNLDYVMKVGCTTSSSISSAFKNKTNNTVSTGFLVDNSLQINIIPLMSLQRPLTDKSRNWLILESNPTWQVLSAFQNRNDSS